jgi:hypothetical protein
MRTRRRRAHKAKVHRALRLRSADRMTSAAATVAAHQFSDTKTATLRSWAAVADDIALTLLCGRAANGTLQPFSMRHTRFHSPHAVSATAHAWSVPVVLSFEWLCIHAVHRRRARNEARIRHTCECTQRGPRAALAAAPEQFRPVSQLAAWPQLADGAPSPHSSCPPALPLTPRSLAAHCAPFGRCCNRVAW